MKRFLSRIFKKYLCEILIAVSQISGLVFDMTYFGKNILYFYFPCAVILWNLRGKIKFDQVLRTGLYMLVFEIAAQLLGYTFLPTWYIPKMQHLIFGMGFLFPPEEMFYWYGGFLLALLIVLYKREFPWSGSES